MDRRISSQQSGRGAPRVRARALTRKRKGSASRYSNAFSANTPSNNIIIAEEFVDVETAEAADRTGFSKLLAYLKQHRNRVRVILIEKTDRLYRNIKDWSTFDEFGVSIHFVNEGTIIGPESRSSDQFVHGIKVLMARNYSVVLANFEVADELGVAFLPSIPLFASFGGAGGGFLGFLSQSRGASV